MGRRRTTVVLTGDSGDDCGWGRRSIGCSHKWPNGRRIALKTLLDLDCQDAIASVWVNEDAAAVTTFTCNAAALAEQ
jgi:hypothetical protein